MCDSREDGHNCYGFPENELKPCSLCVKKQRVDIRGSAYLECIGWVISKKALLSV